MVRLLVILPPAPPNVFSFETTKHNGAKLQEFLLNHYKESTFNICEHQSLSLMKYSLMRLMKNPDANPVAYHTSVPVPLHWQAVLKAGLD